MGVIELPLAGSGRQRAAGAKAASGRVRLSGQFHSMSNFESEIDAAERQLTGGLTGQRNSTGWLNENGGFLPIFGEIDRRKLTS
ncbi:MAG: hypothetical protein V4574_02510 [Pseudomonadota bacterium]